MPVLCLLISWLNSRKGWRWIGLGRDTENSILALSPIYPPLLWFRWVGFGWVPNLIHRIAIPTQNPTRDQNNHPNQKLPNKKNKINTLSTALYLLDCNVEAFECISQLRFRRLCQNLLPRFFVGNVQHWKRDGKRASETLICCLSNLNQAPFY